MLKMSLMSSGVVAPRGLAGSPSHFSVQVLWICSPGLWASSPGVSRVDGVAGLAGVVLSWMSWTCAGGDTGEEADFDYETRGKKEDGCGFTSTWKSSGWSGNVGTQSQRATEFEGGEEEDAGIRNFVFSSSELPAFLKIYKTKTV